MSIRNNIAFLQSTLPSSVQLVCVSKFHPVESLREAYDAGQRVFGESKVQELAEKYQQLPDDIKWHFIGHLQTNKVKQLLPYVHLIHGVDSEKLLFEIEKEAQKQARTINCLLQVHIAKEATKFGFGKEEILALIQKENFKTLKHVRICGLMGMATFTDNKDLVRSEFRVLTHLFKEVKSKIPTIHANFKEISMGMSDDYQIAIEEGSTLVRIGSAIFGSRN